MVLLPNLPYPNGAASNQMVQKHLLKAYSENSTPHSPFNWQQTSSSCSGAHEEHSVKNFTVVNTCVIKTKLFKDK